MKQSRQELAKVQAFYYQKIADGMSEAEAGNLIQYCNLNPKIWHASAYPKWNRDRVYRIKPETVKHKGGEYPAPIKDEKFKGGIYSFYFDSEFKCIRELYMIDPLHDCKFTMISAGLAWDTKEKALEAGKIFYNLGG